jgi:hypothetical protein
MKNCNCSEIQFTVKSETDGKLKVGQLSHGTCSICGKLWYLRELKGTAALVAPSLIPIKEKPLKKSKKTRAPLIRQVWTELTGQAPPTWTNDSVLDAISTVRDGRKGLFIGADIETIAVEYGGVAHFAVTFDVTIAKALQSTLIRTTFVTPDWRPQYGQKFTCITIGCLLPGEWIELAPTYLDGGGMIFLLGQAQRYGDLFAKRLGLRKMVFNEGEPGGYLLLLPSVSVPEGEGPGTELLKMLREMGLPSCQLCYELAMRMNTYGVSGCREKLDTIVDEMMPRAREWWKGTDWRKKTVVFWKSRISALNMLSGLAEADPAAQGKLDAMLKACVRSQVVSAIDTYEKNNAVPVSGSGAAG